MPWVALSVPLTQTIWTKDEGFPGWFRHVMSAAKWLKIKQNFSRKSHQSDTGNRTETELYDARGLISSIAAELFSSVAFWVDPRGIIASVTKDGSCWNRPMIVLVYTTSLSRDGVSLHPLVSVGFQSGIVCCRHVLVRGLRQIGLMWLNCWHDPLGQMGAPGFYL